MCLSGRARWPPLPSPPVASGEESGVGNGGLGDLNVVECGQAINPGRHFAGMKCGGVAEVQIVLVQHHEIRCNLPRTREAGPRGVVEPRGSGRSAAGCGVRWAAPDPNKGRIFQHGERLHVHAGRHLGLRRHAHTSAGDVVSASVVSAHELVAGHLSARQREPPMGAPIFKRSHRAASATPKHDVPVDHSPSEGYLGHLSRRRRDIPALLRIVGVHRSSTSLSVRDRDTQVIRTVPEACSASVRTESRCSGVPSKMAASHVPQTPS